MLFEAVLFLSATFLGEPGSNLAIEVRNFTIITHLPLMFLAEFFRFAEGPVGTVFFMIVAFGLMASLWGLLLLLITRLARWIWLHLARWQKHAFWIAAGICAMVLLAQAVVSGLPQTPVPFAPAPETKAVVEGNNAFALDLYQKLKDKPGNLFCSPFSISSALAMTCAGARGRTEAEMTNVLHLGLPPGQLHPAFKALLTRLDGVQRWHRITLKCANSLWKQEDHPFSTDFLKTVHENYSAEATPVDFKNNPAAAVAEINRWIEEKTNGKIPGGFDASQFGPNAQLALCDAIYFKGKWLHPFKKSETKPAPFYITTNETVTVPMMFGHAEFKHATAEYGMLEMLELPYSGQDLSMVILMPSKFVPEDEHFDIHDLDLKLTPENLRGWLAELDRHGAHKTSVWLPRFTTRSSFDLADDLKAMGMTSAFSGAADFSGMDGTRSLYLTDVFHKTFVEVNEAGTEAAAVSIVLAKTKGGSSPFEVDRPFIFLIRDNASGSILFLGRMLDPTKQF
ncbi:MAG: serpin family protein [Verrucomicrobiae bacterium]|nr:serpin family protein [Verrucomicrobiae bacterium]